MCSSKYILSQNLSWNNQNKGWNIIFPNKNKQYFLVEHGQINKSCWGFPTKVASPGFLLVFILRKWLNWKMKTFLNQEETSDYFVHITLYFYVSLCLFKHLLVELFLKMDLLISSYRGKIWQMSWFLRKQRTGKRCQLFSQKSFIAKFNWIGS